MTERLDRARCALVAPWSRLDSRSGARMPERVAKRAGVGNTRAQSDADPVLRAGQIEYCRGVTEEMNRLQREHRTKLAAVPRELPALTGARRRFWSCFSKVSVDEAWKEMAEAFRQKPFTKSALS